MIKRGAGTTVPTDQEITTTFEEIKKIIPEDQVKTILQAREGIEVLLGFCIGIYEAYQKLDLVLTMDSHQKDLETALATLQEAKEDREKAWEIAESNHVVAIASLFSELETKKVFVANEKTILDTEIRSLEEEKVSLENALIESKKTFDVYTITELQTKNDELARLQAKITAAETQLAEVQTTIATLRSKLE